MPSSEFIAASNSTPPQEDWKAALDRDGFVVVKNVISKERAAHYVDEMNSWVEGFGRGYNRNDPSTWIEENLPVNFKGGMYHDYAVAHEKFTWDARTEPAIVDLFAKIWGTHELLASFDGINLTPPVQDPDRRAWPHIDQCPNRLTKLQCVQGILNLNPNGPQDGGLAVYKGSHKLSKEFFDVHTVNDIGTWGYEDFYLFDDIQRKWFTEDKECELVKVCMEPGDFVLWDSRTVHYNVPPQGDVVRAATYICFTPAAFAKPTDLARKKEIFEIWGRTTHWPHANLHLDHKVPKRNGVPDPLHRAEPINKPELTDKLLKYAGVKAY